MQFRHLQKKFPRRQSKIGLPKLGQKLIRKDFGMGDFRKGYKKLGQTCKIFLKAQRHGEELVTMF